MSLNIPKKKIFLTLPIALISFELYLGVLLGYFIARLFGGKEAGHTGLIKSIQISLGRYRIHIHHWLIGAGILASSLIFSFSFPFPQFSYGILGGLIFQGILSYSDWHKVLVKKKEIGLFQ